MSIAYKVGEGRYRVESPVVVNRRDGSVLVRVPAGVFEMGDGEEDDCPKHRVELSGYWIGVYGVTNRQWRKFAQETGRKSGADSEEREEKLDHPKVNVDWEEARAYCRWAGGDLPAEAQWEKAARGPLGLIYPWGNEWDEGKCRNDKNRGGGNTCEAWGYAGGASGYGTYQQSGNVWEWCLDWYGKKYYGESVGKDPVGPGTGASRVYRGGSWRFGFTGLFRGARRLMHDPGRRFDYLGFRLVRTA
jgi:formylglycine-generating enzyme required for sulfatase activity